MDRRNFIGGAAWMAFSMSVFGSVVKKSDGSFGGNCQTTKDILGPFYRPDAPIRKDLTYSGLKGTIVNLRGKVFSEDCSTPLKNVLVEIWHCNAEGQYDNESKEFNQRARAYTDETGNYSFKTILPGKYLNGELFRPSHIHFRVSSEQTKELVSQIYFRGDPDIAKDPWASIPKANERVLEIFPEDTKGNLMVKFDIYVSKKG